MDCIKEALPKFLSPKGYRNWDNAAPPEDLSVDVTTFQGFGTPAGLFRLVENPGLPSMVRFYGSRRQ
jgi:hypothetical protein